MIAPKPTIARGALAFVLAVGLALPGFADIKVFNAAVKASPVKRGGVSRSEILCVFPVA